MATRALWTAVAITAAALASGGTATADQPGPRCDRGEFCAWPDRDYAGEPRRLDLESANPGECIPLGDGLVARSFVNNLTRDTTVFQGAACSTEAEFTTYPGKGTYVPDAPFVVRAIQVWGP
ncbi:peptidase inhibitor family I36 protein [Saccharothrix australiensis]|uniref:Peptidase inhibitor family I36 n=1 Tax=Saccharothrix australiensis TaxID=2072 RepID=A0A495VYH8_9PSEU|nr:peptidase inhibitor family I36 protein [Saccharothrix australiensis]RKT53455.1 peptidase inhibitor family I36 [Saccharothrix australiensis]